MPKDTLAIERTARCCCGDLFVKVVGQPKIHGVCHCKDCQARTGSAFGVSAYFDREQVISLPDHARCYFVDNLNWLKNHGERQEQERFFCNQCGTTLFWTVSTLSNMMGVAGGCFIDEPLPEPTYSMSESSKCQWLELSGQLKRSK